MEYFVTLEQTICYVIPTLEVGGAERQLSYLAPGLRDHGWSTRVVTLYREGPFAKVFREQGVPVHCLEAGGLRDLGGWWRLRGLLRDARPAIVHSLLFDANVWCGAALRLSRGKAVFVSGRRDVDTWKRRRHHLAERWSGYRAAAIVSNSRAAADWCQAREHLPAERYQMIPNGVPEPAPSSLATLQAMRARYDVPQGVPCLGCVGTLSYKKGQDILLQTLPLLAQRNMRPVVLFIGDGPARETYESQAQRLRVTTQVRWCGAQAEVGAFYRLMSIHVSPSRYESMPNALLEAMAHGVPVVAANVGGVAEVVTEGETGHLVPPEDPQALADVLMELLTNQNAQSALGRAGQELVAERFGVLRMVQAHDTLYRSLEGVT